MIGRKLGKSGCLRGGCLYRNPENSHSRGPADPESGANISRKIFESRLLRLTSGH